MARPDGEGFVEAAVYGDDLSRGLAEALRDEEEIRLGLVGRGDRALRQGAVGVEPGQLEFKYCISKVSDQVCPMRFMWNPAKEAANLAAHGVDFSTARQAFDDPRALVVFDAIHSDKRELRWWMLGKIDGRILLVRYTHRPSGIIRIIGAGYWRQGKKLYEDHWKKHS